MRLHGKHGLIAGALLGALVVASCHKSENRAAAEAQAYAYQPRVPSPALRQAADRFEYREVRLRIDDAAIGRTLKHNLGSGRFAAAVAALARLDATYRADPHYEDLYRATLNAVASCDDPDRPIEHALLNFESVRPKSPWPHLLLGHYYGATACRLRGEGWANDVGSAAWRAIGNFERRAVAELQQALSIDPRLFPAYEDLIFASDTVGNLKYTTAIYKRSRKYLPASFFLAADYMIALEPRWGGTHRLMYEFAHAMGKHLALNPRFYMLNGAVYADKAQTAFIARRYALALHLYYDALRYGDSPGWLLGAGYVAEQGHNYHVAYAYYHRYLHYVPDDADARKTLKWLTPYCDPASHPECNHPPGAPWGNEALPEAGTAP